MDDKPKPDQTLPPDQIPSYHRPNQMPDHPTTAPPPLEPLPEDDDHASKGDKQ